MEIGDWLALVACVLAWIIPKRIMWQETYSSLIADYRSYDYAVAVQGIIEFFKVDCGSDIDRIKTEYENRFKVEVQGKVKNEVGKEIDNHAIRQTDPALCLHYQRRLLAQFFYQLDLCAQTVYIGERRVCRDFTAGEANLVRLVLLMDAAIDESDTLWQDISCDHRVRPPAHEKGMNKYLSHIYSVLKNSKRHMEV